MIVGRGSMTPSSPSPPPSAITTTSPPHTEKLDLNLSLTRPSTVGFVQANARKIPTESTTTIASIFRRFFGTNNMVSAAAKQKVQTIIEENPVGKFSVLLPSLLLSLSLSPFLPREARRAEISELTR
jgi:hypothetical protein